MTIAGVIALAIVFTYQVKVYYLGSLYYYESLGSEYFALAGLILSSGVFITIYSFVAPSKALNQSASIFSPPNALKHSGRCGNCGGQLLEEFVSCPHCGIPLKKKCPTCGKENMANWVICPYCNHKYVATTAPPAEQEMKESEVSKMVSQKEPSEAKPAARINLLFMVLGLIMIVFWFMLDMLTSSPDRASEVDLILIVDVLVGVVLISLSFIAPLINKRRANSN